MKSKTVIVDLLLVSYNVFTKLLLQSRGGGGVTSIHCRLLYRYIFYIRAVKMKYYRCTNTSTNNVKQYMYLKIIQTICYIGV